MNKYQTIIIGGGLSGLSLACFLKERESNHDLLLLEKSGRFGGAIHTFTSDGIIAEPGPHGFLDNCTEMQHLLAHLDLQSTCVKASLQEFVRYVYHDGRLKKIEQSLGKILFAPLISPLEKIGILRDLFKNPLGGEPTVAEWTAYHFGSALLPYIDAVYTGTYAGDINRLAIDSVMPGVRAIEKEHGSIIRGLFAKMRANRKSCKKHRGLPAMTSFPQGMEQLISCLVEKLSGYESCTMQTNCAVSSIKNDGKRWVVKNESGTAFADNIVVALPINAALTLLDGIAETPSSVVDASIANIAVTLPAAAKIPAGFGFLVPEQEGKYILGTLFSSNMFAGRTPQDTQLVEVLVGGRRHSERLIQRKEEIIQRAVADLRDILKLGCDVISAQLLPRSGTIPQLEVGSSALLQWKKKKEAQYQSQKTKLAICGFGWNGIGVNDMVKASWGVAERLCHKTNQSDATEVKPIYF